MSKHYHFIGIGGIGMSGIASLLLCSKEKVSGSDLRETAITRSLTSAGATIYLGHRPENINGADTVIYSSAIKEDNPELKEARRRGIPLLRRAEALAILMREKKVITVTGSHGKTTTTSLVSYLLMKAGLSPTVAIGGILRNIDTNACLGNGEFFVAEADESDGSFLFYHPVYSIVTNIDREHLDYYRNFNREVAAFREFIEKTDKGGCVFCCADDENIKKIVFGYAGKCILFGLNPPADIYPQKIKLSGLTSEFDCLYRDKFVDRFHLSLGGLHNISNALAVIALGLELGIDIMTIKEALSEYKGARRRLEIKFEDQRYLVIDDYAHHPTEIRATLLAVRQLNRKRLIAIFQPHRYSRTRILLEEFAISFESADCVIITDIYPASEPPIEGINGRRVCEQIKQNNPEKEVLYMPKEEIVGFILKIIKPHDLVLTLGAGDIVKICDELVERLKGNSN
ncbi:MAG: UDP-N-acetylmuramate--L-alanine ligase [Candidatus Omnitrophica bacterium]|nr:UDP-N-acetylmuramate--L-alanine ligase [Candidatus Omnitrophota bacterium]